MCKTILSGNSKLEIASILGSLTDLHIWDLAKKITREEQLQHIGRNILQLPDYEVRSVMHNKKYAIASREILELWSKNQNTKEEAYGNLYTALCNNGWSQKAELLRQWAQGGKQQFKMFYKL